MLDLDRVLGFWMTQTLNLKCRHSQALNIPSADGIMGWSNYRLFRGLFFPSHPLRQVVSGWLSLLLFNMIVTLSSPPTGQRRTHMAEHSEGVEMQGAAARSSVRIGGASP